MQLVCVHVDCSYGNLDVPCSLRSFPVSDGPFQEGSMDKCVP